MYRLKKDIRIHKNLRDEYIAENREILKKTFLNLFVFI